jgi:hypothetical protein
MAQRDKLEIFGLSNDFISYSEALGLSKVFEAYAENSAEADAIMEIGFNENTGYIYIALENGITIACSFGDLVEYIVYDPETDEEAFYDSYDDAQESLYGK